MPRPLSSKPGFERLPGGSYRDRGAQLGVKSAGDLADLAVNSLMDASMARRLSAQRAVMRLWRQMPQAWQRHAQGVSLRPTRTGHELLVFLDSSAWV